jgi:membrane fusion protein (multidrug efflux system)
MTKSPKEVTATEEKAPITAKPSQLLKQIGMTVGVLGVICAVGYYGHDALTHAETDDAYISGHVHQVGSQLADEVNNVLVDDNQEVKKGDLLVQLDPRQYEGYKLIAEANMAKAKSDYERQKPLYYQSKAISEQDFTSTLKSYQVDQAELELAQLELTYTEIRAPSDGTVARKNVEVGNRISAGQALMELVEPHVWVTANFKETQIAQMKVGQEVNVSVDRIPGHVFKGYIDSFAPGTGNEFALLPADNSTGNFTKVVQRVPVKIEFDPGSIKGYEKVLVPGLSVDVKVKL